MELIHLKIRNSISDIIVNTWYVHYTNINIMLGHSKIQKPQLSHRVLVLGGTLLPNVHYPLVVTMKNYFLLGSLSTPGVYCHNYNK